jgi:signal transduction histidine kinase
MGYRPLPRHDAGGELLGLEKTNEETMLRNTMIGALAAAALTLGAVAFAQGSIGTAAEAKAMLEKAVAAVKADKAKAIEMFKAGTGGFKDRDLYVFCFNSGDGIINAAPPAVMGKDVRTLKDKSGKDYGKEIYDSAKEGTFTEVSYMFPKPGTDVPVPKRSFVTKVADQTCGVGYYPG